MADVQTTINTPREVTHQRIAAAMEIIAQNASDVHEASNINYNNTASGLSANKVQGAVDELALAGFVTNTVNNLVNYYLKSETYNKTEVDSLITAVKNSRFEVVSTLPTTDIKTNVIYLVPKLPTQTSNAKDEYINLDGTSSGWEKIGDTEVDLSGYVTTTALNTALSNYTTTANLTNLLDNKVDKVEGKGLSTNDYTDADKNKLAGIQAGANKTVVDSALSDRSTNPLQNRVVNAFLNEKTDINNFNALTQEIELFNTYDLSNDVEISVFANDTYKRDKYDRVYETHIPNLDGEYFVSLGDKTFTETCTFTIANQGTSITETFHTNSKYILGAKLLKAENDEVGDAHVIADVVTLIISKDAPYTTTFDPFFEHPPVTGVLTLKVSVKPDEKYVNKENTGGPAEYAYWGSYNGSDLLINNPILTYSETTFGQPKVSGNPVTINDAAEANAVDVSVDIEPIQDLHGYDHPWVGGAGKNKFDISDVSSSYWNISGEQIANVVTDARQNFQLVVQGYYNDQFTGVIYLQGNVTSTGSVSFTFTIGNNDNVDKLLVKHNGTQQDIIISYVNWTQKGDVTISFDVSGYNPVVVGGLVLSNIQIESGSQATSYEPYSNICPISGWDEVNVGDVGKNIATTEIYKNNYVLASDGAENYASGFIITKEIKIDSSKSCYLSMIGKQSSSSDAIRVGFYDKFLNFISRIEKSTPIPITIPNNAEYIRLSYRNIDPYFKDIQIEIGNQATTYEPYKGKTYTIQLKDEQGNPITVYGGECDVVNGDGTGKFGYVDLGDLNYSSFSQGGNAMFNATLTGVVGASQKSISEGYANGYLYGWQNLPNGYFRTYENGIRIKNDEYSDVNAFKTSVTGIKLVYELAEPYTIKLTPQQIKLLKGTNNISCNTGDLSIKYYPDNVLGQLKGDIESEYDAIIQNLLERIEALENQQ